MQRKQECHIVLLLLLFSFFTIFIYTRFGIFVPQLFIYLGLFGNIMATLLLFRRKSYITFMVSSTFLMILLQGILYLFFEIELLTSAVTDQSVLSEQIQFKSLTALIAALSIYNFVCLFITPSVREWQLSSRIQLSCRLQSFFSARSLKGWAIVFFIIYALSLSHRPFIFEAPFGLIRSFSLIPETFVLPLMVIASLGLLTCINVSAVLFGISKGPFRFCVVVGILCYFIFGLLIGERAPFLGIVFGLGILYHMRTKCKFKNLKLGMLMILVLFAAIFWAEVRTRYIGEVMPSIIIETLQKQILGEGSEGVSIVPRFFSHAWTHLNASVFLWDMGVRRYGQTYVNLLSQVVPEFISSGVGITRPINDAWILGEYWSHGGGFFIIAQGYWNYGFAGAIGVGLVLGILLGFIERQFRRADPIYHSGYFAVLIGIYSGVSYGAQTMFRLIQIGAMMSLILWYLVHKNPRQPWKISMHPLG